MPFKMKKPSPAFVISCIALFVALGTPAAYAANTVFSTDIVDGEVKTDDLALNSIGTGRVINNSLSANDIRGADVKDGVISLSAGAVPNGRCQDFAVATPGAKVNETVVFSLRGPAPAGLLFTGVRVPTANTITLKVCNLTGGIMSAVTDLPVRIMTFG